MGYTLDELRNDITGTTSACFEPAIDYVVTKIPRWTFEKFPEADATLTTQMKSVGETMAIGRTFAESFQKAIRGTEVKRFGYGLDRNDKWLMALRALGSQQMVLGPYDAEPDVMIPPASAEGDAEALPEGSTSPPGLPELRTADGELVEWPIPEDKLSRKLAVPGQARIFFIRYAFKLGWDLEKVARLTKIDPWFLDQMKALVEFEETLFEHNELEEVPRDVMLYALIQDKL